MSEDLRNIVGWVVWGLLAITAIVWSAAVEFFSDEEDL